MVFQRYGFVDRGSWFTCSCSNITHVVYSMLGPGEVELYLYILVPGRYELYYIYSYRVGRVMYGTIYMLRPGRSSFIYIYSYRVGMSFIIYTRTG